MNRSKVEIMKYILGGFTLMITVSCVHGATVAAHANRSEAVILDVFPSSQLEIPFERQGQTVMSQTYTPTESLWGKHLDEKTVFHHEIKHVQGFRHRW